MGRKYRDVSNPERFLPFGGQQYGEGRVGCQDGTHEARESLRAVWAPKVKLLNSAARLSQDVRRRIVADRTGPTFRLAIIVEQRERRDHPNAVKVATTKVTRRQRDGTTRAVKVRDIVRKDRKLTHWHKVATVTTVDPSKLGWPEAIQRGWNQAGNVGRRRIGTDFRPAGLTTILRAK